MGIVIRQSAISTLISYIGVVIGYINLLFLYPKYMSPEEVGLTRIIQDGAMLMVPFAQLGVSQLILRYFPEHRDKPQYKEFVGFVFSFITVTLLLFVVLFIAFNTPIASYFSQQSPAVIQYLNYILVLILVLTINQVMVAFSNSSLNIVLPNFLKEIVLRLLTLLGIVLFALQLITFYQFIYLLIAAYLLNLIALIVFLATKGLLKIQFQRSYFNLTIIKGMLNYSLFTFLAASGIMIIGKVDSLMVTGMLGLKETAIYTTAFYIAVVIELPKRAISQIGMPIISRAFERNDLEEIKGIYSKSSINNLVIGLLFFIGLWINLENIFTLIPRSEVYSLGSMVVLIIGAGKLFDMVAGLNGEIIVMSKYYRVNVYLIIGLAIITVLANYLLIPIYGLNGAAIGSAFALIIFNISKYLFLYYKFKFQPFTANTIKALLIGAITVIIGFWLPKLDNIYFDIIYRSFVVTIFYGAATYLLKVSDDINDQVKRLLG